MLGALNAMFIDLIPKKNNPITLKDFRSISLCDSVYKIVSKVIANRLKKTLSRVILDEKFGFLFNRNIHDAVGTTPEGFHSIKGGKQVAVIMKIDLSKAYDKVNWIFFRFVVLLTSMNLQYVSWVMRCLEST
jgi:hypothetical protein